MAGHCRGLAGDGDEFDINSKMQREAMESLKHGKNMISLTRQGYSINMMVIVLKVCM